MNLRRALLTLLLSSATCAAQDVTPVIHVPNPPNMLAQQSKHYVVLVSLDGFRYDYPREYATPHLTEMARDLGIEGRSKMTRDELRDAVAEASRTAPTGGRKAS